MKNKEEMYMDVRYVITLDTQQDSIEWTKETKKKIIIIEETTTEGMMTI